MYIFILGYILGVFTMLAWNLQKAGTVNLKFSQWLIIASIIAVLIYLSHRFIDFDFLVSEETVGFSFEMLLLPLLIIAILIFYLLLKKKKEEV